MEGAYLSAFFSFVVVVVVVAVDAIENGEGHDDIEMIQQWVP